MRLASIHTYPIKSCYRVDRDRAPVRRWGLEGDRRWLVVDAETGRAVTQRDTTRFTRVRPRHRPDGSGLIISTPGLTDLAVAEPAEGERMPVTVWRSTVTAARAGPAADEWFSTALDRKVRLVWLADPTLRAVTASYGMPGDTVTFADAFPVLLANLSSLAALNDLIAESRSLDGPLPMTRFRPNLVVADVPAWAEDGWLGQRLRIGDVTFRVVKPSGRCIVTTTDQETGDRGPEPLRTLGRHRKAEQGLLFATHLIPDSSGEVAVGDRVRVME